MKPCHTVQEKLVAGEILCEQERSHLQACTDCASFAGIAESVADLMQAARKSRPAASEVQAVQQHFQRRIHPPSPLLRLAWASAALLVGVFTAVAVVSGLLGPDPREQSERRLVALMDEVSAITGSDAYREEEDIFSTGLLVGEADAGAEPELELPDSYRLLEEALENSWL